MKCTCSGRKTVQPCCRSVKNLLASRLLSKFASGSVWVRNLFSDVKGGT
jgi:hypothetical protein